MDQSRRAVYLLLSIIGFIITAYFVTTRDRLNIDTNVITFFRQFEHATLTKAMIFLTHLGSYKAIVTVFIISGAIFLFKHWKKAFWLITAMLLTTPIINQLLKQLFIRERPNTHQLIEISGYSFPSGHTMHAVSLYGMLIYIIVQAPLKKAIKIFSVTSLLLLIILIAISRIYLGVHYPSDIIGGAFASLALIFATQIICSTLSDNAKKKSIT